MTPRRTTEPNPSAAAGGVPLARFVEDVQYYLLQTPRQLPSRYLYDELGSALFEAICRLPWYGITRAEARLLVAHAPAVWRSLAPLTTIVELGSGSGEKLRALIARGGRPARDLSVHLVDVSPSALELSARTLSSLERLRVVPHVGTYEQGLAEIAREAPAAGRTLVLFLGSNIGNFDPPSASALLLAIRAAVSAGDGLLLGADLVKPLHALELAYDDPLGVTAAFNLNLLVRINRELGGDFDVTRFQHRAVWNADDARVEMHLVSRRRQPVRIALAGLSFTMEDQEPIWTESSYKYGPEEITSMLGSAGFQLSAQWCDHDARFAVTLVTAI